MSDEWDAIPTHPGMAYDAYLRTPAWARRRSFVLRRAGGRCRLCGQAGALEVYHTTRERLGAERMGDLIALCPECHRRVQGPRRAVRGAVGPGRRAAWPVCPTCRSQVKPGTRRCPNCLRDMPPAAPD